MMSSGRGPARVRRWALAAVLGSAVAWVTAPTARSGEDVARIRDKCVELRQKVLEAQYENVAEGKPSRLTRVYKDFDYLLKDSKTSAILEAQRAANDPATADRLRRLHAYLLHQRMLGRAAPVTDNTIDYLRAGSIKVPGFESELTLRSAPVLLAQEEQRSNRRNGYLASRQLQDNANVFLLNLQIDLDRTGTELAAVSYPEFLRETWGLDAAAMDALARDVLQATEAEYAGLLAETAEGELDGMAVKDLRAYDAPRLFRFAGLDGSFPRGKSEEAAQRWLRDLGFDLKGQRYLRLSLDPVEGKSPEPTTFAIDVERSVRVSVFPVGGLPDYLALLEQLGQAEFHHHIDPALPFEDRSLGSPLLARTYGLLFRGVIHDPAWRTRYLKVREEDAERAAKALRLNRLLTLRRAAAHHLFQVALRSDPKPPPARYAEQMQTALGWSQTATEETDYLSAEDYWASGIYLTAAVLAEQIRQRLVAEFGSEWFASPQAGARLREHWSRGFRTSGEQLPASWGLAELDSGVLLGPASEDAGGEALAPSDSGEGGAASVSPPESGPEAP